MPATTTVTVHDLEDVMQWARKHASAEDQARIGAIVEAFGRDKARQFGGQPTQWEIDWFYRGKAKEFYRLALVNTATSRELWGYS
jgi:hypothetical protein